MERTMISMGASSRKECWPVAQAGAASTCTLRQGCRVSGPCQGCEALLIWAYGTTSKRQQERVPSFIGPATMSF